MTTPYTGGCACGAVRYRIASEPLAMFDCQCRQCQRESGTGHSSHMTFRADAVETSGKVSLWRTKGDQGGAKDRAFCPRCGCTVYATLPDMPDYFVVRAGSLDEPGRFAPQFVLWTAAAQAWDAHDGAIAKFERMAPG